MLSESSVMQQKGHNDNVDGASSIMLIRYTNLNQVGKYRVIFRHYLVSQDPFATRTQPIFFTKLQAQLQTFTFVRVSSFSWLFYWVSCYSEKQEIERNRAFPCLCLRCIMYDYQQEF